MSQIKCHIQYVPPHPYGPEPNHVLQYNTENLAKERGDVACLTIIGSARLSRCQVTKCTKLQVREV